MKVGVLAETRPGERRVAMVPATVPRLTRIGLDVLVESGAGRHAYARDEDYVAAGATVVAVATIADRATGAAQRFADAGLEYRHVFGLDDFMARNHTAGLLVLDRGRIVCERYGLGLGAHDRLTIRVQRIVFSAEAQIRIAKVAMRHSA